MHFKIYSIYSGFVAVLISLLMCNWRTHLENISRLPRYKQAA